MRRKTAWERWVGGWVVWKMEEDEAVEMSYCRLWVGGWVTYCIDCSHEVEEGGFGVPIHQVVVEEGEEEGEEDGGEFCPGLVPWVGGWVGGLGGGERGGSNALRERGGWAGGWVGGWVGRGVLPKPHNGRKDRVYQRVEEPEPSYNHTENGTQEGDPPTHPPTHPSTHPPTSGPQWTRKPCLSTSLRAKNHQLSRRELQRGRRSWVRDLLLVAVHTTTRRQTSGL